MSSTSHAKLTSTELASLWNAYISQTHNECVLHYFIAKVEDADMATVLNNAYQTVVDLKESCKQILQSEHIPVPMGFSSQDVDVNAPRLFPDSFFLMYLKNMSRIMVAAWGLMYTLSSRKDIREHFKSCLSQSTSIFDQVSDVLLEKGIYTRPPFIDPPKKTDLIENRDYMDGKSFLKESRYLNAVEISHVFANIEANVIGHSLTQGFSQTADQKNVREFMKKASQLSEKVITDLTQFLTESKLPAPMGSETQVFSSTIPPFSDRLMMYEMSVLSSAGISDYATSLSVSMRNDLTEQYMSLLTGTSKLAKEAELIMIKNHWLEQPPQQEKITP